MGDTITKVELADTSLFTSRQMEKLLETYGTRISQDVAVRTAALQRGRSTKGIGARFGVKTKKLDRTYVAIVHPTDRASLAIAAAHPEVFNQ